MLKWMTPSRHDEIPNPGECVYPFALHKRILYQQSSQSFHAFHQGRYKWIIHSDDCFLPYMIYSCGGNRNHQVLCHSKLRKLLDYDTEHGLDYTRTLQGYLENNCSQAEACRALFLHRSTLIQRLKRISEISKLDLDDEDTRLYLLMYFALLKQRGVIE